jgi:hypothetical protein
MARALSYKVKLNGPFWFVAGRRVSETCPLGRLFNIISTVEGTRQSPLLFAGFCGRIDPAALKSNRPVLMIAYMADKSPPNALWLSIAAVAGTILGGTAAPLVNYWTNERQMDIKMVEIGVSILRAPPNDDIALIRSWAIDTIENSSGRKFTAAQRTALVKQELPVRDEINLSRRFLQDAGFSKSQIDEIIRRPKSPDYPDLPSLR